MTTNRINKAVAFCRRRGIPYTVAEIKYGFQRVEISAETWSEYEAISSAARKLRGVEVETNIYARTIWLYSADEYMEICVRGINICTLSEVFWQAIHAGRSQTEARAEQEAYALANGLTEAYAEIYS